MEECALTNICRACLTEEGEFQSVFVPDENTGLALHLAEMMSACASVQVTFGDGLPEQICKACASRTVNTYLFKLQCETSDAVLRKRLKKSPMHYTSDQLNIYSANNALQPPSECIIIKPELNLEQDEMQPQPNIVIEEFDHFNRLEVDHSDSESSGINDDFAQLEERPKLDKNFECEICQKRFSRHDLLLRHKIAHALKMGLAAQKVDMHNSAGIGNEASPLVIKTEEDVMYTCQECDLVFVNKDDLDVHMDSHDKKFLDTREIGYDKQCIICPKKFRKQSHLNRHMKIHSAVKPHVCTICNKGFLRPEQLANHMNIHTGKKPHTCDICFKGFNQISNLKDHMRTHNGERPFLCSTCGKGFNQLGNLRQHTIRHTGIKAHLCSTCGSGFASKGELSAHLRKHTGARPFVCTICHHGFTTSSSLTKHKRIHSGEKPYECDVCKMKFSRSGILARHKRTHTGEKPYVCKYCTKAFSQSNDLTSHMRIHTGEKPYICDVCGQAFRQSSALKSHKKTHLMRSMLEMDKNVNIYC